MTKNKSNIARNLFFLFGMIAMLLIAYGIGFKAIVEHVRRTGWWFFAIIGMWLPIYLVNALAFNTIIRDNNPDHRIIPFMHVFKVVLSGFALKAATPLGFVGGDPYKIVELKALLGVEKATSSVVLYTMTHITAHCIFWVLSIIATVVFMPMKQVWVITLLLVLLSFILVLFLIWGAYRKGLAVKFFAFLGHIPLLKRWFLPWADKYKEQLTLIDTQISYLYSDRRKAFFKALSLEVVARILNCLEVYVILRPVDIEVSLIQSVVIYAFMSLFTNILFFSPMQLGTREGGFVLALRALSLPARLGLYVSLVTRVRELVWIGIGVLLMKYKSKSVIKMEMQIEAKRNHHAAGEIADGSSL